MECFDYTFFPSLYDLEVTLHSKDILKAEVFGSTTKGIEVAKEGHVFPITSSKSCFPSALLRREGQLLMRGGLILVKLAVEPGSSKLKGEFRMRYRRVGHLDVQERRVPFESQFGDAEGQSREAVRSAV